MFTLISLTVNLNIDEIILNNDDISNRVCAIFQKNLGHSMSRVQNFKLAWRHFHGINCYKGISSLFVSFIQLFLSAPSKRVSQFSEHGIGRFSFKFWLIQWLQKKMKISYSVLIQAKSYIYISQLIICILNFQNLEYLFI